MVQIELNEEDISLLQQALLSQITVANFLMVNEMNEEGIRNRGAVMGALSKLLEKVNVAKNSKGENDELSA